MNQVLSAIALIVKAIDGIKYLVSTIKRLLNKKKIDKAFESENADDLNDIFK